VGGEVEDAGLRGFARGVGLQEVGEGAGGLVFGGEGGELGELLVDEAEGRGEVLGVDVVGEEAADVAFIE